MKKFVIYTALFGKRSVFRMPKISSLGIDRICFTDLDLEDNFYQVRKMKLDHLTSVRRQRFVKICIPDEIFDNYEYSFYLDYKHPSTVNFDWLLSHMKLQTDFLIRQHRVRDCIYDEGVKCIKKGKGSKEIILNQLDFYRNENYPAHNGLYASFILFRRHTQGLKELSRLWWEEVERWSFRDQISLPYVIWKHGIEISSCGRPQ